MKPFVMISTILIGLLGLTACSHFEKITSHYGHGKYRCYYLNERTNASFKGVAGDKAKALSQAKEACEADMKQVGGMCLFADCVFK